MQHPEFNLIDTAFNGPKKRNHLMMIEDLVLPENPIDCYRTYGRHDKTYLKHLRTNNGSVRNYRGPAYVDFVPFDLDAADPSEALKVARNFLPYLESTYDVSPDEMGTFYSGLKGFHFEMPIGLLGSVQPVTDIYRRLKRFVRAFGDWPFDLQIYRNNGLWRITNTIHSGSGLRKIRLRPVELFSLSMHDIKDLARNPVSEEKFADYDDCLPNEALVNQWQKTKTSWVTLQAERRHPGIKSFSFLESGVIKGSRNSTAFSHAQKLRACGKTLDEAIKLMLIWNKKNHPSMSSSELRKTIESAFSYTGKTFDAQNILQFLQLDPFFQGLVASQRDVLISILARLEAKPSDPIDDKGYQYHLEVGEMLFSFRGFPKDCAPDVGEASVRSLVNKLRQLGRIELITLGSKRLSILRLIDYDTHGKAEGNTPNE